MTKKGVYKYEHTNGKIIEKNAAMIDYYGGPEDYFDSPFVKRWWYEPSDEEIDTSDIPEANEDWFKKAKLRTP